MDTPPDVVDLRQATGLPYVDVLLEPARLAVARDVVLKVGESTLLDKLVHLAGRVAAAECAQVSLLADQQVARSVHCGHSHYSEQIGALQDSLCTVTVLSGDILVAADARSHPWLHDLPPVTSGAVVAYLGIPLRLTDGTAVGALCVYGSQPREWSDRDVTLVAAVADVVTLELQRLAGS